MYLIYDTETTSLPLWNSAFNHPDQARVIQLAALVLDDSYEEVASFSTLIQPDGWVITPGAQMAHGITLEDCARKGIFIKTALAVFSEFERLCHVHVAHNIKFDSFLLDVERSHCKVPQGRPYSEQYCTMLNTTEVCKLPGKFGKYKWPKLIEAYQHIFHDTFEGAHDALADVRACAKVFKWLRNKEISGYASYGTTIN
jgi:DNA polymerase III subunit epsilon